MLKDAILIDQELLQTYFLNGGDLSSVQISVPEMDASDLPDISNIAVLVRNQLIADLPALLSEIQFSSDDLFDLVEEILSDYICYLKESGYLEMGQLADYLREYFSSEAFSSVVRGWLDTLDPENRDGRIFSCICGSVPHCRGPPANLNFQRIQIDWRYITWMLTKKDYGSAVNLSR